ncbi:4-carboxy-4-hydroxy-2-oxoadipate aldolase/oxaloacetate decarboxylase [bacterium RCC_150]
MTTKSEVTKLPSATLHEAAGRTGALPSRIRPAYPGAKLAGPAYPVICASGDNLWLHRAVYQASPGDVLVVAPTDDVDYGYWGEILSEAAIARGLGGLVIDGGVRDTGLLAAAGFPVFSSSICIRGTVKNPAAPGGTPSAVTLGEVRVSRGDLIVGDADGVVCVDREDIDSVMTAAVEREAKEEHIIQAIRAGQSTLDLFGLR